MLVFINKADPWVITAHAQLQYAARRYTHCAWAIGIILLFCISGGCVLLSAKGWIQLWDVGRWSSCLYWGHLVLVVLYLVPPSFLLHLLPDPSLRSQVLIFFPVSQLASFLSNCPILVQCKAVVVINSQNINNNLITLLSASFFSQSVPSNNNYYGETCDSREDIESPCIMTKSIDHE